MKLQTEDNSVTQAMTAADEMMTDDAGQRSVAMEDGAPGEAGLRNAPYINAPYIEVAPIKR
jgi:hypothetical protein